jgi:HTH-type transcriptional regulator/antitoxin HigA
MDPPDPVDAILFRMDQMNLKQKDLAPYFGGKTKISEVLNRKRPLSLRTIALLHENLRIPLDSLVRTKKPITNL